VTIRAASNSGKVEPSATTTCPAAKMPRASSSVSRRGIRRVSRAIDGEPKIIPIANTAISSRREPH
jgi:hypothetical protein